MCTKLDGRSRYRPLTKLNLNNKSRKTFGRNIIIIISYIRGRAAAALREKNKSPAIRFDSGPMMQFFCHRVTRRVVGCIGYYRTYYYYYPVSPCARASLHNNYFNMSSRRLPKCAHTQSRRVASGVCVHLSKNITNTSPSPRSSVPTRHEHTTHTHTHARAHNTRRGSSAPTVWSILYYYWIRVALVRSRETT
jgi:hypothetical protein